MNDLNTKLQDMQYDLQKSQHQVEKLIKRINEISSPRSGSTSMPSTPSSAKPGSVPVTNPQVFQTVKT